MFKVTGSEIEITRGDTAVLELELVQPDGTPYEVKSGDEVLLTVKTDIRTKEFVFQKSFVNSQVKILPTDTESLSYGSLVYDIQLKTASGDVFTVIGPSKFTICGEVTW